METKKENNQPPPPQPAMPAGMPEWLMPLLTGLGTMGAEYMLFIKPLQEKVEQQSQVIKDQGERIDELEDLLQGRRKPKRLIQEGDDENEEEDTGLFQVKRKPSVLPKYAKHARIKL